MQVVVSTHLFSGMSDTFLQIYIIFKPITSTRKARKAEKGKQSNRSTSRKQRARTLHVSIHHLPSQISTSRLLTQYYDISVPRHLNIRPSQTSQFWECRLNEITKSRNRKILMFHKEAQHLSSAARYLSSSTFRFKNIVRSRQPVNPLWGSVISPSY